MLNVEPAFEMHSQQIDRNRILYIQIRHIDFQEEINLLVFENFYHTYIHELQQMNSNFLAN